MASAAALLAELHGRTFRRLTLEVGDRMGLTVAAREARRQRRITPTLARKLERLDIATHFAQHINAVKIEAVQAWLEEELTASQPRVDGEPASLAAVPAVSPDPWWQGADPWSSHRAEQGERVLDAMGA